MSVGGVDSSLYPVAVLIDELRHDDLQLRVSAVKQLGTIATALGPERTREELLPFLQEIIDDDDDVLVAMAEQLGNGVDLVGGPAFCHALIGPLEELCNVEEITVREKALEALRSIAGHMSPEQVLQHLCGLIGRLATHDWFTSRISVCSLFAAALRKVGDAKKQELLKKYFTLCGDDTPMVRRQAALALADIAEVAGSTNHRDLLEVFEKLAKDEQDSVRILAINNCITLGRIGAGQWQDQILEVVRACVDEKSWRVRYMVADNVKALCDVFKEKAVGSIIPLYLRLLGDAEVEVRTIAAARVADVAAVNPSKEFLEQLMPALEKLTATREQSQHVRASLAGGVLQLCSVFGQQLTVDYLINIFLQLIRDECPDVRLQLLNHLEHLSTTVGVEVLAQSLLPSIKDLGKDRQWRVRLAVINVMPDLAKYLGEAKFTSELAGPLFAAWLMDPVFSVRDAFAASFKRLSEEMGQRWSEVNIIPQLQTLIEHKNYLYRISAILSARALAEAGGRELIDTHLIPMVMKLTSDPVPNVRFNAAKTIKAMHKVCSKGGAFDSQLVPCLYRLLQDEDPDVKFFAQKAISELGG